MTLPSYCDQCDVFGHVAAVCPHYHGQERAEGNFAPRAEHAYGRYTLQRLGLDRSLKRAIGMNGRSWSVGEAVSVDNNCLVDTLRQVLEADCIPWYYGYLEHVRHDLATGAFATQNVIQVPRIHSEPTSSSSWSTHVRW